MSEPRKPKRKVTTFKQINKNESDIVKIDSQTYYVKGSQPEPYMVFHSINEGWLCDCMNFVMNMTDAGNKPCKHIKKINSLFNTPS